MRESAKTCRNALETAYGCGEARGMDVAIRAQVIPCQASDGPAQAGGSEEGVETRSTPPNGVTHECPAPQVNVCRAEALTG